MLSEKERNYPRKNINYYSTIVIWILKMQNEVFKFNITAEQNPEVLNLPVTSKSHTDCYV